MSDFSGSPPPSASPSASPPPPATTSQHSRRAQQQPAPTSNWLSATNGVTAFAPPEQRQETFIQPRPREGSRQEVIQEYMRAYANGEVGRERVAETPAQEGGIGHGGGERMDDMHVSGLHEMQPEQPQEQQHQPFDPSPEAAAYRTFLTGAQHRKLQRHDLAVRDAIWAESLTRTQARLAQVSEEKATLERKLVEMGRERARYKESNVVAVSEVDDQREERRWEEWLRVQRGVEVGPGGSGGGVEDGEEEGGVDI